MVKHKRPYRSTYKNHARRPARNRFRSINPKVAVGGAALLGGALAATAVNAVNKNEIGRKKTKLSETPHSFKKGCEACTLIKEIETAQKYNSGDCIRASGATVASILLIAVAIRLASERRNRVRKKEPAPETVDSVEEPAKKKPERKKVRPKKELLNERERTPSEPPKPGKKKEKKKTKLTVEKLTAAIDGVMGEHAGDIAEILIMLRRRRIVREKNLRRILTEPTYVKGIMKWKKAFVKPLMEGRGLEYEALSNGNGNGKHEERDSYPPDNPNYVTTEEALKSLGIEGTARGIKPSELHRALRKSGFDILPASGGHLKIYYKGEVVKDSENKPVMVVKSSAATEIPPGTLTNIAKSTYRFKRMKDAKEAA